MPDESPRHARRAWLQRTVAAMLAAAAAPATAADPPMPSGLSAPARPAAMPAFELPTTAGPVLRSESMKGQVAVIRFWASW